MRFSLKYLTACLLRAICLAGTASADEAGILYWMVNKPTIVRNCETVASLKDYTSPEGYVADAARVVATKDGETVFLNLYEGTTVGGDFSLTEMIDIDLDGDFCAGPVVASLPGLNAESYTYAIELGAFDSVGGWVTLAVSDPRTFGEIAEFSKLDDLSLPPAIWQPTTYNVPEPTGGLLTLLGLAVLALRRKEMRK